MQQRVMQRISMASRVRRRGPCRQPLCQRDVMRHEPVDSDCIRDVCANRIVM
jgi:hypothetical protein